MKTFLLLLASAHVCMASSLVWNKSVTPEVAGYRIYCNRLLIADVGNVSRYVLPRKYNKVGYSFYVTSYNGNGLESIPSNVVFK